MSDDSIRKLLEAIITNLFRADDRRIVDFETNMINRNSEVLMKRLEGFVYLGIQYRMPGMKGRVTSDNLHESLHSAMDTHLTDKAKVHSDKQQISQILLKLIDGCMRGPGFPQELRDTLPDCLTVMVYPHGNAPERIRSEAFTLTDDPRAMRQYLKILPLIQAYSVGRLLY